MVSAIRGETVRKLDFLWAFATAVLVLNIPFAIVLFDASELLVSVVGGGVGILHFQRLTHTVDLLCHAPVAGMPAAPPKRKIHRFKTVEGSRTWSTQRRIRIIECSSCGTQRELVWTHGNGE